ncbi:MAG: endolytic transglycosylase MltG [Patescibacteria group bacterium]|nr:endolytic transglycosylase MltG [Patescibacteria group bacterium]
MEELTPKKSIFKTILIVFFFFAVFLYFINFNSGNNRDVVIHISSGQKLNDIVLKLEQEEIIKSSALLQSLVIFFNDDKQVPKGDYFFREGIGVFETAWMLANGEHRVNPIKITFPEGFNNEDIARVLSNKLDDFDNTEFISKANQGYMFPDTYFFFPLITIDEIIKDLSFNFERKTKNLNINEDVIIMASLIEGEAKGEEDAYIISGILWKRIEKGIALQVDVDRWTYKNKGLPENPISNPGLNSIKAALNPKESNYLYYIHDKEGQIHYAKTYNGHKVNINKYLK